MSHDEDALPVLDHVQVAAPAGCEEQARRFYGELLGLVEVEKPAALAQRGGVWFALGAGAQLHVGVARGLCPRGQGPSGVAHRDDRAAGDAGRRLAAVGAAVVWDSELPGVRRFFTADPFGNRLELLAIG